MAANLATDTCIDYKFWTDVFTSFVSLAVALTAVVFTIKQSKASIKHNRLSVRPVICHNFDNPNDTLIYSITNKGLGTARVSEFRFIFHDQILNYEEFESEFRKKYDSFIDAVNTFHIASQTNNSYIAKDEKIIILQFSFTKTLSLTEQKKIQIIKDLEKHCSLEFEYSSLYNTKPKHEFKFSSKS
tara:strand:- start:645 stop:1202 length:558 start_codon:yes stop_codon:yes gene_type:complete